MLLFNKSRYKLAAISSDTIMLCFRRSADTQSENHEVSSFFTDL